MVACGPSGVPSRPGVRLGDDVEQLKRLQIAVQNASAYQRQPLSLSLFQTKARREERGGLT
jgi:hypothetical protein